ncbi:hypothetical protein BJ170DRAFT_644519 [Xylariales sp. AK1849]|nr:hypothetical protein BJ170DRAFT_644519 [Xylariales sp. AK1849]
MGRHATHYFVPLLLASPPSSASAFVVVGSIAGAITKGIIANSKYCISKMAQILIMEHLASQFKERGAAYSCRAPRVCLDRDREYDGPGGVQEV